MIAFLRSGRGLVLAGIVLSAFNLRTAVTSLTPLLEAIGADVGFGTVTMGVFGMMPVAAFALFGGLTPRIANRIGLERAAWLCMVLAGAGLLWRGFVGGTGGLLAASALALAGMGIGNVVLPPLVKRYFPRRVGLVSTLYIASMQVGTIVAAMAAVPLADAFGWKVSLASWSALALAASLPWVAVLLAERRAASPLAALHDYALERDAEASARAAPAPAGRVWRSPLAWGMTLMFGATSLITYSMFTWLPKLLTEAGASAEFGGVMLGLFSALGLLPALLVPWLTTRVRPLPMVAGCILLFVVAFAGLLFWPMRATVLWVLLLGVAPSTFPMSLTLINLRTRTQAGSAALSGFMQCVGYSFSCVGPLGFGWLHQATGDWRASFLFLGASLAALLLGGWLVNRPTYLEDTW